MTINSCAEKEESPMWFHLDDNLPHCFKSGCWCDYYYAPQKEIARKSLVKFHRDLMSHKKLKCRDNCWCKEYDN